MSHSDEIDYSKPSYEKQIASLNVIGEPVDIGAVAAKGMPSHMRFRYCQKVSYVTADGEVLASTMSAISKPKLRQRVESARQNVAQGAVAAYYYARKSDGQYEFRGITTKYTIGA